MVKRLKVSKIVGHTDEFKLCSDKKCQTINLKENKTCIACGKTKFKKLKEEYIKGILNTMGDIELEA